MLAVRCRRPPLSKSKVVDAGCGDSPGGVDEGLESFAWGEVEMWEIVDGGVQVARAAI
jgi:hypothetical protein